MFIYVCVCLGRYRCLCFVVGVGVRGVWEVVWNNR